MKEYLAALALIGLSAIPANSQSVEFHGVFCLTATNATCVANAWNEGACFYMRYTPPDIGDTGSSTNLNLFDNGFALGHRLDSGTLTGTAFVSVDVYKAARNSYLFQSQMRVTNQSPSTLTATTLNVNLSGNIKTWDSIANCTVNFRASATRRPLSP